MFIKEKIYFYYFIIYMKNINIYKYIFENTFLEIKIKKIQKLIYEKC